MMIICVVKKKLLLEEIALAKRAVSFGLLLIALLLTGCTPGVAEKTPASLATPSAAPTTALTPAPTVGVTENQIGYVRTASTTGGKNYIDIDYVQFLTGQAAIDAAKADGKAEKDEHGNWYVPNDYYIVNDNPKLRTFEVSPTASIKIVDLSSGVKLKSITFVQLKTMGPTFADRKLLMHCNVANGIVVALEEQFRP
jgi:hypothetical protein